MTLRIADEVIEMGLRSKKGFAAFMQDRIGSELTRAFRGTNYGKPDLVLLMEGFYMLEPLHVHGVISMPAQPHARDLVTRALMRAGGNVTDPSRQLRLKPLTHLPGWFSYIIERPLVTKDALKRERQVRGITVTRTRESLVGVSAQIRARAKGWYSTARESGGVIAEPRMRRSRGRARST